MNDKIRFSKWQISAESNLSDSFCESVFFSANGRMGARAYPSLEHGGPPNETGLFAAGVFANLKKDITDFVNLPTPFCYEVSSGGGTPATPKNLRYALDLRGGKQTFEYDLDFCGKTVRVLEERFFSLANLAVACERVTFTPLCDIDLTILSGIKLDCCNNPINDDQTKINNEQVDLINSKQTTFNKNSLKLNFQTFGTNIKLREELNFKLTNAKIVENIQTEKLSGFKIKANAKENTPIIIEKTAKILTSRDVMPFENLAENADFDTLYRENLSAWEKRWETANIELHGNSEKDSALRYVIFELTANDFKDDPTVSIGARGLTHTRYKGCYFWDTDFFMLPFYIFTCPEAAKSLALYRANNLEAAKENAKKYNLSGARYPWMCSFDGSEQCESWDIGASEIHITADVVFALNEFITATQDSDFYKTKAAEIYIETARFFTRRYTTEAGTDKVNLLFCKGPDEYCGITENNLFTNAMAKYNVELAIAAAKFLQVSEPAKFENLGLSDKEISDFETFKEAIKLPKDSKTGHFLQDDTFSSLEPVDIKKLKDGDLASYNKVSFDRVQRYKVIKQADVILLMTRFKNKFTKKERVAAWEDFEPLCLHDSTLSFATHALFAAENGLNAAAKFYFEKALFLDLRDVMGNTGNEGLHMACFGETWNSVVFGYCGLDFRDETPILHPNLPEDISGIDFKFFYKGKKYKANIKRTADNGSYKTSLEVVE